MLSDTFNSTRPAQSIVPEWPWSFRSIFVLTVCGFITILTILGNGLVLLSVKFRLHARSYSDYFIVSLCLADFFVGLFVMPLMTIHSMHLRWPFHYRLCYIWMSIDFTCSTASFLTLASMALDRYYALTAPYFHLRNRSYTSVLVCIISSWIIPFAIWPSSIFLAHHFDSNEPGCFHPARPLIIVLLCTFFYYIPLLFMLVCYSRIIVNIKNIEVMIRGTWDTLKLNQVDNESKSTIVSTHQEYGRVISDGKNPQSISQPSPIHSFSLRSLWLKCCRWRASRRVLKNTSTTGNGSPCVVHNTGINRQSRRGNVANQGAVPNHLSPISITISTAAVHRVNRHMATTATFTGQKRCLNDNMDDNRSKTDLNSNPEEDQLVRARLSSRTSSLPAARCVSYYYYQNQVLSPTRTTAVVAEEPNRDGHVFHSRFNSIVNERSRSQSHSSSQGVPNGGLATTDASEHSSSFDNPLDEEHRRLNRRAPPSHLSTSYNSSRYSQRAVAQFMHERNKARLRRNQKASRMLGLLLAVFLVCWLPFTISYPTMVFFPNRFPAELESVVFWLGYVNSLLNPFLYVYSSRNFRQAIMETLCCYARFRSRQHLRYRWSLRN